MSRSDSGFVPDGRTRLLGIVGDPIDHSLSPRLHSEVLRRLDRNLIYVPFPVSRSRLRAFVRDAGGFGVVGFNVTTPYKEAVARYTRPADLETRRAGVVNTVGYREGVPFGAGTDGAGILGYLRACGLADEPFGVLGFGATARSLVVRAVSEGAPLEVVVTRRPGRAARALREWGGRARAVPWSWVSGRSRSGSRPRLDPGVRSASPPRLWISTLPPATRAPEGFWTIAGPRGILCDLNYGAGRASLAEQARSAGWRAADGHGPLCHQAALSLQVWLELEVPVRDFIRALGRTARSLRPGR